MSEMLGNNIAKVDIDFSEELLNEKVQVPNEGENPQEEIEIAEEGSPIEKLAASYGWKPEGKKSAEDYVKFALEQLPERGEALSKQKSEINELKAVAKELASHMEKQKKQAYEQAINDLRSQKRQAIANGDLDRFDQLDQQEADYSRNTAATHAVEAFKAKHKEWLTGVSFKELEMQQYATAMDNALAVKNLPPERHMQLLEQQVLQKFPDYFGTSEDAPPSTVDSLQNSNVVGQKSGKKAFSFNDLSPEQKGVARYLETSGALKVKDYIKQLVELGDLK